MKSNKKQPGPVRPASLLLLLFTLAHGQAQSPAPVETQWPGITAQIIRIIRLPDNRVSAKFYFVSSPSAPKTTFIADQVIDETGSNLEAARPYNLESATLIDEADGTSYPLGERRAGEARPGRPEIMVPLPASSGFMIGQIFKCPPVNLDDPPKKQFVSFQLPGLKQPITGVPLPREENKPVGLSIMNRRGSSPQRPD